ncbi:MAG TPA: lipid-A-disaccharide synthase, partial [Thiotrichales bacterium]|nr:lipid-A-disaccharide synthase [Thiotrichales bacterium]
EFNQRLAAYAKQRGVKVLFYIGPQVWAWRPKRVYKMAKIVDHLAVILPFEADYYKDTSLPVTFTGHPLTDEVRADKTPQQARAALQLDDCTTVGLFPGSRSGEIKRVLPILLETAKRLRQQQPGLQFVLPVASTINRSNLADFSADLTRLNVQLIEDRFYDVTQACDVVLTASGTAALEICLLGRPMVIVYKIAPLSHFILKQLVTVKYLGLMNIIAGREIVKEFIQGNARPDAIADEALRLLTDTTYNTNMRHELSLIREQLGAGGGAKNIAQLAWRMLTQSQQQ